MFWMAKTPAAQAQQQDERVQLHIEVTDNKGHYINGLQPKDFRILEDGVAQKVDAFAENENSYNVTYFPAQNPNEGFRKIDVQIVPMSASTECGASRAIRPVVQSRKIRSSPLP